MKNLYVIVVIIFCKSFYAQDLQNSNWMLAQHGGLNFNTPTPSPLTSNVSVLTALSSASVSDQQGNLLFYTDGTTVWNSMNNVIANGTGLMGGIGGDFSQNIVIIPNPLNINRYYIVTISLNQFVGQQHGLRYTEVDMSTIAGQVLLPINIPLNDDLGVPINDTYEINFGKLTTARHANGLDYWLIAQIGEEIFSYHVSDLGINLQTVSPSPLPTLAYAPMLPNSIGSVNGPMRISPNNSRILIGYSLAIEENSGEAVGRIFRGLFDDSNGEISNFVELGIPNDCLQLNLALTGAEFSPDSNIIHRVYETNGYSDVIITRDGEVNHTILELPDARNLQRAINDRIYFETNGSINSLLSVINSPNSFPYNYEFQTVNVGSTLSVFSGVIPTWVQWQPCHRFLTTTDVITTSINRERNNWIRSTNQINTLGTVIYHAGDFVELNPGFETQNASEFAAYIQGCTNNTDFVYKN